MKSITIEKYGSPKNLSLREVAKPEISDTEVLVQVEASCVSTADTMMRKGEPKFARLFLGLKKPRQNRIGTGFSGRIIQVGQKVSKWKLADSVFGLTATHFGANSEFVKIDSEALLWKKPTYINFKQASCMCDGVTTSMNFLTRLIKTQPGERILIQGATGSLGMAAIGIAKSMDLEVIAACSKNQFSTVYELGADFAIEYKSDDWIEQIKELGKFNYIYDTVGKLTSNQIKCVLPDDGVYLTPVLTMVFLKNWVNPFFKVKNKFDATGLLKNKEFNTFIKDSLNLIKNKQVQIVMDKVFDFEEFQKAHEYVDSGRKKGNVCLIHKQTTHST